MRIAEYREWREPIYVLVTTDVAGITLRTSPMSWIDACIAKRRATASGFVSSVEAAEDYE